MNNKKSKYGILFVILTAVVMGVVLFSGDDPAAVFKAIRSAKPVFILSAVGCMVIYWVLESAILYKVCGAVNGKYSFFKCVRTSMMGQLFNCITPFSSGGQPMQLYQMNKSGVSVGKASCALLTKFIIYQSMLTAYAVAVIFIKLKFFVAEISGFVLFALIGFIVNVVVMFLIVSIGFFPKIIKKMVNTVILLLHKIKIVKDTNNAVNKAGVQIDEFYENFTHIRKNLAKFILPSLLTVVQLTAFFTVPYFVCLSLSVTGAQYITVVCAAALVLMFSSFVPLPGGAGGAEGGFYLLFGIFFHQVGIIAVAIVLWRVLTFYLPIVVGMCFCGSIGGAKKLKIKCINKNII